MPTSPDVREPFTPTEQWRPRRRRRVLTIVGALIFLLALAVYWGVCAEVPVDYPTDDKHFQYGSIGSDSTSGIPYWIWAVLPETFPQYLPEPDAFTRLPAERR